MVKNGIDVLLDTGAYDSILKGKRIGLITTPTGLTKNYTSTIDALHERYQLLALFSPEHGIRGNKGAGEFIDTYRDLKTGVNVYSLYRSDGKRLTEDMLDAVDVILYDIQDVGVRYYTFIYTMLYALEDCGKKGKQFIVLDRPNPLGLEWVEGNRLKEEFKSFVGGYPLCNRYGLTVGEFAIMANEQMHFQTDLVVVPCEGYHRNMMFPQYDTPWIMPSSGLPRFESALLYAGTCLFEGTNISEGRGTTAPFEIVGAPFIDAQKLATTMNEKKLPGVQFLPTYFSPTTSKHQGMDCEGVHILVNSYRQVEAVALGIHLLIAIKDMYPEKFEFLKPYQQGGRRMIELLCGDSILLKPHCCAKTIVDTYKKEASEFAQETLKYHIYN